MNARLQTPLYSCLLVLLAGCSQPGTVSPGPVSPGPDDTMGPANSDAVHEGPKYRVMIDVDAAAETAHMTASITSIAPSSIPAEGLTLRFPRRFAFVTLPPTFTEPLTASSNGELLPFPVQQDEYTFVVDTNGATEVELTWSIPLSYRTDPEVIAGTDQYEHSYVTEGHGMLFTGELIALPDLHLASAEVWFAGPLAPTAVAPWPLLKGSDGSPRAWSPEADELGDDIMLVGDAWRLIEAEAHGLRVTFALAPEAAWLEPLVHEVFLPIVNAEISLFGWAPRDRFLFVFGPTMGMLGTGGSPKSGSITLFASQGGDPASTRSSLAHLIAHEFHHTWGRGPAVGAQPVDALRFVTEGYTDYYAYVVPWRLGMISDATFHRTLESRITAGARALEVYGRSLTEAGGPEFFAGREAYDACYAAGLALALWTDLALRKHGHKDGLEALMRDWYRPLDDGGVAARDIESWEELLRSRLPGQEVDSYMSVISRTETIDWESFFDVVSLTVEQKESRIEVSPSCLPLLRPE